MIVFNRLGGRGTVGVRGMIVFNRLGGRGLVGVRGMTLFTRLTRSNCKRSNSAIYFCSFKKFITASHGRGRLCRH